MSVNTSSRLSSTIKKLQRSSEAIELLLDDLRTMLEKPASESNARLVGAVLDEMGDNLRIQFELEEEQGYLADVLEQFPNWHPHVEHLREQHELLRRQLREVKERLAKCDQNSALSHEICLQLHDWIQTYAEHEQRERRLMQEAFTLEPGAGE